MGRYRIFGFVSLGGSCGAFWLRGRKAERRETTWYVTDRGGELHIVTGTSGRFENGTFKVYHQDKGEWAECIRIYVNPISVSAEDR